MPLFGIGIFKKNTEHPLDIKLQTYFRLPDYGEHLGLIPVLKRHIRTLCALKLNAIKIPFTEIRIRKERKLLVFVDDLDRCKSDYIAETLDAIRLVMPIPNVIVMICIDHRIAFKAVEKHYRTLAEEEDSGRRSSAEVARDYLGKIVQIPVRLEPIRHENLKKYVYGKLFGFEEDKWKQFKETSESSEISTVTAKTDTSSLDESKDHGPGISKDEGNVVDRDNGGQGADVTKQDGSDTSTAGEEQDKQGIKPHDEKSEGDEDNEKVIEDTPEEGVEFYKLAGLFEFSNPQQLLRLHNSFRFLKALGRRGDGNTLEILKMLFWQEFLHNWPMKVRGRCMATLIDESHVDELDSGVRGVLKNVRGEIVELFNQRTKYQELTDFVRVVVLPHNEEGRLDTAEEITEWLEKEKEEDESRKVKEKEGDGKQQNM